MSVPAHELDEPLPEPQFVSLSHVVAPASGELDDALTVFTIASGETLTIYPPGDVENHVYRGIFAALQGPPKTREEVIAELELTEPDEIDFAGKVFDALSDRAAITAVSGLARALTPTWQNPQPYPPVGLPLAEQGIDRIKSYTVGSGAATYPFSVEPAFERATTRKFDRSAPLSFDALQRILIDSYRTSPDDKRPTPSPGGIYPVTLHVVNHSERIIDDTNKAALPSGIYQYDPRNLTLIQQTSLDIPSGIAAVEHLTDDLEGADPAAWIMLGVDVAAFEQKYGNASQMFLGISIGSVMQRIIEEAERAGYGTLPTFGIQHQYGDDILNNPDTVKTVLAIGIGREQNLEPEIGDNSHKAIVTAQLERVRVGIEGIVSEVGEVQFGNSHKTGMPNCFVGVWAQYPQKLTDGSVIDGYSFGTASTSHEAELKAIAEALERVASGNIRIDQPLLTALELDSSWIDPRIVLPLDGEQRAIAETRLFTPETKINWTAGTRMGSGEKVYAPTSLIYYPYLNTEDVVAEASSSGVAAHFDRDEAAKRGLLELIERNAIMRTWILQQTPNILGMEAMPLSAAYRVNEIAVYGKQADVLDITQADGLPVYMVAIRSDTFPHLFVGAAANFDAEAAINKALDEAVSGFSSRVVHEESTRKEEARKREKGIFDTDSHGMLYAEDPAMVKTIDWLFSGNHISLAKRSHIPTLEDLIRIYRPAMFELDNPAIGSDLKVIRVVSNDLVPILFGNIGVPYLHHTLPKHAMPPAQPHFFN